jgi:hypothetical protein
MASGSDGGAFSLKGLCRLLNLISHSVTKMNPTAMLDRGWLRWRWSRISQDQTLLPKLGLERVAIV